MHVCIYIGHAHLLHKVGSPTHFCISWQSALLLLFLHSLSLSSSTSISLYNFMASGSAVVLWVIDIENIERGK